MHAFTARLALLAALAAPLLAAPAEAKRSKPAPLPPGVVEVTPDEAGALPKTATLIVAVLSHGEAADYRLSVSGFPRAKAPIRRPKSAAPPGGADLGVEPDWQAELERARAAGFPSPAPEVRRTMAAKRKAKPPAVGSHETFYVTSRADGTAGDVPVTLKVVTDHANWWVDDRLKADAKALAKGAAAFEKKTYKRVRKVFGKEIKAFEGGDPRLNFVVTPLKGIGGYFAPGQLWPNATPRAGYGRKTLVIASSYLDSPDLDAIIAHEFEHLVSFSRKCVPHAYRVSEDSWLEEGFGELAVDVASRAPKSGTRAAMWRAGRWLADTDALPLEVAIPKSPDRNAAYGRSYLFARYLADRFGEDVVADVLSTDQAGRAGLDLVLEPRGARFDEVWRDFTVTLATAAGAKPRGKRFAYKTLDLRAPELALIPEDAAGPAVGGKLQPYSVRYHTFRAAKPQAWKIELQGEGARAIALAGADR